MESAVVKPSRIYYGVSVFVFIAGLILFFIVLIFGIFSSINAIGTQVVVPGSEIIELDKAGKYIIFHEYKSVVDGKIYSSNSINGLYCTLTNVKTGEDITLSITTPNMNYSVNGREGRSVFEFNIDEPGRYELKAWYGQRDGEEAVLAVGKGFGAGLFVTIILCIGILFGSIVISILIFVITFLKRRKYKNENLMKPDMGVM
ncbi:MAG TPA: hypothetical protein GXZ28_00240 [Clostridiales bacterium]|nr:hypothetical protein [Clostridiales bacterium]